MDLYGGGAVMGVPVGQADGDHICLLECQDCGERYETDETMTNECPDCYSPSWEMVEGTGPGDDLSWREEQA